MIIYSNKELQDIFTNSDFLEKYKLYEDKYNLLNFLDSIDLNKDYYKVKLSSKYDQSENNKSLQKSVEYLNKITSENYKIITDKIMDLLNESIVNEYTSKVIEKVIQHENFSNEYIYIIDKINNKYNNKSIINEYIDNLYTNINKKKDNNSEYDKLCDHNKLVDNLVGYYRMIIQINKINLLNNNIDDILVDIISNIKTSDENDQYKYLQCLLSIVKTDKNKKKLIDKCIDKFLLSKKNKFLLMDIFDI